MLGLTLNQLIFSIHSNLLISKTWAFSDVLISGDPIWRLKAYTECLYNETGKYEELFGTNTLFFHSAQHSLGKVVEHYYYTDCKESVT